MHGGPGRAHVPFSDRSCWSTDAVLYVRFLLQIVTCTPFICGVFVVLIAWSSA